MSKKIIYLLSLLMALSLVFASCKKSNPMDALGNQDGPPSTGENDQTSGDNGLYEKSDDMPNDQEFIRRDALFNGSQNGNYYRNPVVVAGRDGAVFIFFEYRYERAGAGNDVGIDGNGKVDIAYITSKNAGKDKFNNKTIKFVNNAGSPTTETNKSHGAPVVYYIKGGNDYKSDSIVIVASAGSGIGRTTQEILQKTPSKIDYIVGTFTSNTDITWKDWKTIETPNLSEAIKSINVGSAYGSDKMTQFGTHAEKGLISGGKLILPVILANQGTSNAGKELMGVYVLSGTVNGSGESTSDITWADASTAIKKGYTGDTGNIAGFGQWKESHIAPRDVNGDNYDVLVIPSPQAGRQNNNTLGKYTSGETVTAINGLPASEGSFGYLLTDKWYGATSYETNKMTSQTPMILYSHVQSQATKLTLHLLDQNRQKVGSFELGATGKSSSIDMLPDGTVIIAAENTKDGAGYYMYFERRSQAQIARLAK